MGFDTEGNKNTTSIYVSSRKFEYNGTKWFKVGMWVSIQRVTKTQAAYLSAVESLITSGQNDLRLVCMFW